MKKLLPLFSLLFIVSFSLKASHIVGGEMHYQYLGSNHYHITLKVNRNCYNPQAPYDDPLSLAVYDSVYDKSADTLADSLIYMLEIPFPGSDTLLNTSNNKCLVAPPNVCVEEALYETDVILPPRPGGYYLVWQRCCRNGSITNIADPSNVGATYVSHIPGPWAYINSDPLFTNFPPTVICADYPFTFDHSATDFDGDSLSYFLTSALDCPAANSNNPGPPPFDSVVYVQPYNSQNPMGGNPSIAIDARTGLLTVTPTDLGQFIVTIGVKEYRHGALLGQHTRDFQFNVVACDISSVVSSFTSKADTGYRIDFSSSGSVNDSTHRWSFGDGGSSTYTDPYHIYKAPGNYITCLTVGNPGGCSSTVCQNVTVGAAITHCAANFILYPDTVPHNWIALNQSVGATPMTYLWSWGDGTTSTGATPSHNYTSEGFYNICLTITDDTGCISTLCDSSAYLFRTEGNVAMVSVNVLGNHINSIAPVTTNIQHLNMFPNPCYTCEVRGIENAADILVTDLLGRTLNPTITRDAAGYVISLPNVATGMFLLRNIKTGEVVKFVKE